MPSATAVLQDCLTVLQDSTLSRIEKLRLEVEIRQATYAASGSEMSEDEARDLVLRVCKEIGQRQQ